MAEKGLLSISEFSKVTGIPRSKLIYYDEIGVFPAAHRAENNYRYYSLNQIIIAGVVNDLASFGLSLKQLLALKDERTPEVMLKIFRDSIIEHQEKIDELRDSQSVMKVMVELMQMGMAAKGKDIEVVHLEAKRYILGGENPYQDAATFYPAWLTFMNSAQKAGINVKFPVGGYFDSMERFAAEPNMPSRFYFINPRGKDLREAGRYLTGYTRGFYGQAVDDLPERMLAYASEHGLEITGPVFNSFLLDEMCMVNPEDYLLRVSVRVKE